MLKERNTLQLISYKNFLLLFEILYFLQEPTYGNRLKPLQVYCWKRALFLELLLGDDTRVHIFVQIEKRDSKECVVSEGMVDDGKRLVVSAR